MLLFWSLALLLIAVTLAFLLPPLVRGRRRGAAAPDADAAAIAVYRDQKRALDADIASGAISAAERDAAVLELSRRLGEEVAAPTQRSHLPRPRAWVVAIALLIVIPLAAVALYARLGSPDATAPTVAGSAPVPHEMSDPEMIALVEKLAQRMKSRPDDGEGWALLARSYTALGRFPEAADAYARADALMPDNPTLLVDYADALAMSQGKRLAGKPAELARRALALDPKQKKGLALAATAAMEVRDFDGALVYWRRLAAEFPPDSDDARDINSIIAEVESDKGSGKAKAGVQAVPRAPAAAPASGEPQVARSAGGTITGRVDIAPAIAPKVALTDTVFIFARAADGPRVPLAVLRIAARELPRDFTLDDSMGMAPGAKLSAASAVIVEARVSKSGNALPQPGDLTGRSAAVKPGTAGLKITIDQVVP
jgi:cytochrome c-type biogenesis protein CcmH